MDKIKKNITDRKAPFRVGMLAIIVAIIISGVTSWVLYEHTVNLLTKNLLQSEMSIARTGATAFDAKDLGELQKEEDYKKPAWSKVINQLLKIRANNQEVVFAYILRKNADNPQQMIFVADADSLDPYAKVDLNGDGKIDDADALTPPGTLYEDVPLEAFDGYQGPTTNKDLYEDQWGLLLSGYAPIKDNAGKAVAVLAVDIRAGIFSTITRQTFIPFIIFVSVLIGVLIALAASLIFIWNKRVELVEELDRQKDAVLHMVAHQFKGPVTTINFTTELLLDGSYGKLTAEQQENVTTIRTASQKMGAQSEMVLDAAKITLGKLPLNPVSVDLNELVKEVVEEAQNHARQLKVHMNVILPNQPLPTATLDRKYTQLAIDNLLSNAVKYTALKSEGGNVEFVVSMKGKTLFCSVKDTGIGIPKAEQENIFKELYRASNAGKDGNGLGLRVARGAIEAQGGKMWFESEEGKGTTFFVELPLVNAERK